MSDLTLTRDIDGMLEWEWTNPPCRTYEVGHDVLSDLVDDHNALLERFATLEDGMAQILCVVGLAVAKGQMGDAAPLQRVAQIADTLLAEEAR